MTFKKTLAVILLVFSNIAWAQENLETVMARMKPQKTVRIAYQEVRELDLFSDDWQASGYLYANAPSIMLKQQKNPTLEIMAAEGKELYYYQAETQRFHRMQLDENNELSAHLSVFRRLMMGDLSNLRQMYTLNFSSTSEAWRLELIENRAIDEEKSLTVVMQGQVNQAANSIDITLADGDQFHYALEQPEQTQQIQQELPQLLQELKHH